MSKNLEVGDVVCAMYRDGIIAKKQKVVRVTKTQAVTDADTRLKRNPDWGNDYDIIGSRHSMRLWTEQLQAKSDAAQKHLDLLNKVHRFFERLHINSMQESHLQILSEAIDKINALNEAK